MVAERAPDHLEITTGPAEPLVDDLAAVTGEAIQEEPYCSIPDCRNRIARKAEAKICIKYTAWGRCA